jgi:hypothetical protein
MTSGSLVKMRALIGLFFTFFVLSSVSLIAQDRISILENISKEAIATKVDDGSVIVDGRLNEDVWSLARPILDFVQKEPNEGLPATEQMEVRFLYDGSAVYIGARMFSVNPASIQAPLSRRDDVDAQTEHFLVSFDTFYDRRTAYTFGVSASGVRLDRYHARDEEWRADEGFNPVWEAKTVIDEQGWTAELWIPFSQLRFNDQPNQVWGLNIKRFIPTLEEEDYWVLIPRTERGWASRFGELHGIEGIQPSRRIEFLPVVVGSSITNSNDGQNNPFQRGRTLRKLFGSDLKIGLGSNLTLDATFNPDFGQVDADPAEVNLTAFETRVPERRPFFTEGARLLSVYQTAFYSRRIGARPTGKAEGEFVDYPNNTTILAAAKITGRLSRGTSIGFLSALTDEEFAETADSSGKSTGRMRVGPRTMWAVGRVQQEFGSSGSNVGLMFSGMHRNLSADDPLAQSMSRDAFVYGGDSLIRFKDGEYELTAMAIGSVVSGETSAIESIQESSVHYMQRPDRDYKKINPLRTALTGHSTQITLNRVSGRHWLFGIRNRLDSPGFESNAVGRLNQADGISPRLNLTYRETEPGRIFRRYSFRLENFMEWNYGWNRQRGGVRLLNRLTWLNFWETEISVRRIFRAESAYLTRGGPLMNSPNGWDVDVEIENSGTSKTRWSGEASLSTDELGGTRKELEGTFSFRPSSRLQLSIAPSYERSTNAQQYITTRDEGRSETFDHRYIFSYIDRTTLGTEFRAGMTFKPDLTLDVYAELFAASGHYYDYGELLAPASLDRLRYGTDGTRMHLEANGERVVTADGFDFVLKNKDFNTSSFRSNVVLKWEWRPGSTFFLVWQLDRTDTKSVSSPVDFGNMLGSMNGAGTNVFLMKTSFWLPIG